MISETPRPGEASEPNLWRGTIRRNLDEVEEAESKAKNPDLSCLPGKNMIDGIKGGRQATDPSRLEELEVIYEDNNLHIEDSRWKRRICPNHVPSRDPH